MRHPNIALARSMGFDAALGDATNLDVLLHHGINHAKAIVITVPITGLRSKSSTPCGRLRLTLPSSCGRATTRFVSELEQAGATVAVDEEHLTGIRLAAVFTRGVAGWARILQK